MTGAAPLPSLLADLAAAIRSGGPEDDAAFDALALPLYRALTREIPAWDRLARLRGCPPDDARTSRDVVPVPTDAFRRLDLHAPSAGPVVRVFETSGTTGGDPGRASFDDLALALHDLAIDTNARVHLFPDGPVDRVHVLGPPPERAPAKIMLVGMARLAAVSSAFPPAFHVGPAGMDFAAVHAALAADAAERRTVLVAGASATFVHLVDAWERLGLRGVRLPPGSRVLDAGGWKGLSREVSRDELRAALCTTLGVPAPSCVNLLGMTELSSQFYEDGLAAAARGVSPRPGFVNAPWTRTRVLDPETLAEAADGQEGLLAHWDLAAGTRPFAVLTTDLGVRSGDRFRVTGRARGAALRGCSLGAEVFLDGA